MYFLIYKTTNLINGKYYIGKHQTTNINDRYFGSGKAISNAIKKYGKKNFRKDILFVFDNEQDMNEKEIELVTEEFISTDKNYNMGVGGEGGPHFKGKSHSKETIELILKNRPKAIFTEESRKKISEANRRRGISKEAAEKIRQKALQRYAAKRNMPL